MTGLLPLDQAQARLLALAGALPIELVPIAEAQDRYLTASLRALRTQPAVDLSAMDGYAIGADDLAGPWRVVGESAAGHPWPGTPRRGEAVRISTGALLPDGAGAVLLQENCARDGAQLRLTDGPAAIGQHIRRQGMDFSAGQDLLPVGTRIGPAQIALAITAGHGQLPVCRLPRVAIIDSGDELALPGAPCAPHRVPASNGAMLVALVHGLPCQISRIGPVADSLPALQHAFAAAPGADVIVISGGASVGDHDLVGPALRQWGATIDFWKVAIKPGKPLLVARRGPQIILGLPGNPVSSMITAYLFLLPLLRALLGASQCLPCPLTARLAAPLRASGDRHEFLRARWDGRTIAAATQHDSGTLASLATCNALIARPAASAALPAGADVPAYWLENHVIT